MQYSTADSQEQQQELHSYRTGFALRRQTSCHLLAKDASNHTAYATLPNICNTSLLDCSLEFLLTRDMVCTGLSMLDFKGTVKYSVEDLVTRYGKQASALPVQATAPKGATLDRQHNSQSKSLSHPPHRHGDTNRDDIPLGLKATRVAHAAAVSSRVFSPSMRSSFSGPVQAGLVAALAPPSCHDMDDTLGFVQRQGSFHSEHAIQHLMTDHPHPQHTSRQLHKHHSLPSQRSLHQRDSADSFQGHGSRHSSQTEASNRQSHRSHIPALISHPRLSQHPQNKFSHKPPLGNRQSISSSALFQTIPVSPPHGSDFLDHCEHSEHAAAASARQHSYDRHDSYDNGRQSNGGVVPDEEQYLAAYSQQQPSGMPASDATPRSAFQSADSFASEMVDTDVNQTQHWGKSLLAHMQQVSEGPDSKEDEGGFVSRCAVHAVPGNFEAEGMHPPTGRAEAGPHDWLWLPDELSTINDSLLTSTQDSLPDVQTWLSQQQAARLAKHAQRASSEFKHGGPWQQTASPTSPLNTAHSMNSTFDEGPKAHDTLSWADNALLALAGSASLPSGTFGRVQLPSEAPRLQSQQESHPQCQAPPQLQASPQSQLRLEPQQDAQPQLQTQSQPQPVVEEAGYRSPFAHWSSFPILSPAGESTPAAAVGIQTQHAQQQQQHVTPSEQPQPAQMSHTADRPVLEAADVPSANQQQLDEELAVLESQLEQSVPAEDGIEAFSSPVQTRQLSISHLLDSSCEQLAPDSMLYDTTTPLPVCAPGAVLSAPEEALMATMQEMLESEPCMLCDVVCASGCRCASFDRI